MGWMILIFLNTDKTMIKTKTQFRFLITVVICAIVLCFSSCLMLLLGEQIGDDVETDVACFTTNPNVKISAHHVCGGIRHFMSKKQSDRGWLDIYVKGDSDEVFSLRRDKMLVVSSSGDTLFCTFRDTKAKVAEDYKIESVNDTTVFKLFFSYPHKQKDVYVSVSIKDFPTPSDHTMLVFCVPMSKIEIGPWFRFSKKK